MNEPAVDNLCFHNLYQRPVSLFKARLKSKSVPPTEEDFGPAIEIYYDTEYSGERGTTNHANLFID